MVVRDEQVVDTYQGWFDDVWFKGTAVTKDMILAGYDKQQAAKATKRQPPSRSPSVARGIRDLAAVPEEAVVRAAIAEPAPGLRLCRRAAMVPRRCSRILPRRRLSVWQRPRLLELLRIRRARRRTWRAARAGRPVGDEILDLTWLSCCTLEPSCATLVRGQRGGCCERLGRVSRRLTHAHAPMQRLTM